MLIWLSLELLSFSSVNIISSAFTLSIISNTNLCAVFLPIPGSFDNLGISFVIIAIANSVVDIDDNIPIAVFAPILLTDIRFSNIFFSSKFLNPYNDILSCVTL